MTMTLFISILAIGSILNILLTQAIKKAFKNEGKVAPANFIALADALICGGGVTLVLYLLLAIPFTLNNIVCLVCVVFFTWLGAMDGYDKIIQSAEQIGRIIPKVEDAAAQPDDTHTIADSDGLTSAAAETKIDKNKN